MLEQIKQVSLTYLTQKRLWWVLGLFGLIAIPNVIIASGGRHGTPQLMLFVLGMPLFTLLPFLVGHVKMQFAHSRARLMPNFLEPHLSVLAAIVATLFIVFPLAVAWFSGAGALGLLALTFAIAAPTAWGAFVNRFPPILVAMAAFYSLLTEWGQNFWMTDTPAKAPLHVAIVAVGATVIGVWLWRLCHLDEEMDEYQNNYQAMLARRTGSEAVEQRRLVAAVIGRNRLMSRIQDWWHARLGGYYGGHPTSLARLLRYGFGANPAEVQGVFSLLMFGAIAIFMSKFSFTAKASGGALFGGMWFFVVLMILMPGQMAGELMAQRRPRLSYEMLLPLSRQHLFNGLFAATMWNSAVLWLISNLGFVAIAAALKAPITLPMLLMFLLLSGSCTIVAMGISLRFAVWPSLMKRMVVVWFSWIIVVAPLAGWWWGRSALGDAPFLALSGLMLGVGAFLLHWAKRTWLSLELG